MGKKKKQKITNSTLNVSRFHHDEEESARDLSRDSNQSITRDPYSSWRFHFPMEKKKQLTTIRAYGLRTSVLYTDTPCSSYAARRDWPPRRGYTTPRRCTAARVSRTKTRPANRPCGATVRLCTTPRAGTVWYRNNVYARTCTNIHENKKYMSPDRRGHVGVRTTGVCVRARTERISRKRWERYQRFPQDL